MKEIKFGTRIVAIGVIGIALLFSGAVSAESPSPSSIIIDDMKGEVQIFRTGELQAQPAQMGQALNPDDTIQTGKDASARIAVEGTGEINLGEETTWSYQEFAAEDGKKSFSAYLALGRLKAKVKKLPSGSDFAIKTPTSIAAVRGTAFGLHVYMFEQQYFTELDVTESVVAFSNLTGDQTVLVDEGKTSVGNAEGAITPPQTSGEETVKALKEGERNAAGGPNPPGGGSGPPGAGPRPPGSSDGTILRREGGDSITKYETTDIFNSDVRTRGTTDTFGGVPMPTSDALMTTDSFTRDSYAPADSTMATDTFTRDPYATTDPMMATSDYNLTTFEPQPIYETRTGQTEFQQEITSAGTNVTGDPGPMKIETTCSGSTCPDYCSTHQC